MKSPALSIAALLVAGAVLVGWDKSPAQERARIAPVKVLRVITAVDNPTPGEVAARPYFSAEQGYKIELVGDVFQLSKGGGEAFCVPMSNIAYYRLGKAE